MNRGDGYGSERQRGNDQPGEQVRAGQGQPEDHEDVGRRA